MNLVDFTGATWRKSSRSANASNCVEVAHTGPAIGVRDSKHPALTLTIGRPGWEGLLRALAG